MEDQTQQLSPSPVVPAPKEENVIAGLVGAFLFFLVGVAIWFGIYQFGYIAAFAGLITIVCALKGYEFFGKAMSLKGLFGSLLISVLMIFLAEYICVGYEIYVAYKQEYDITIFVALRSVPDFLGDAEIRTPFITDLLIGYGLTLLGSFKTIANVFSSHRKAKESVGVES